MRQFRHRVHDGVCDTVRALPAAQLGIHQEGSDGTACEEGRQAEDRVVPQEVGAADRGKDEGRYTACVQDEAIRVADARFRKSVYTPKGVRGVYTYTGSHSKTIVFGLITLDGEGFFQRYGSFTGKEFVEFLKAACERFGKILMITDGAPQHRSKFVREEIGRLDGVELQFLPPGCPGLNAIEEVWRRMKHAVLDVPYVRFSSMCSDIDKWLRSSLDMIRN